MDILYGLDTKGWVALAVTMAAGLFGFTMGMMWFQIAPEKGGGPAWWYKALFAIGIGACLAIAVGTFMFASKSL